MGAPRPFRQAGEMWFQEGSKGLGRTAYPDPDACMFSASSRASGEDLRIEVEHDRDRSVVDEIDGHPGAEHAGGHLDAELLQARGEALVEGLGQLGSGRVGEART